MKKSAEMLGLISILASDSRAYKASSIQDFIPKVIAAIKNDNYHIFRDSERIVAAAIWQRVESANKVYLEIIATPHAEDDSMTAVMIGDLLVSKLKEDVVTFKKFHSESGEDQYIQFDQYAGDALVAYLKRTIAGVAG